MTGAAPRVLPEWESHHTVFVTPRNRDLVTAWGTLRRDPNYGEHEGTGFQVVAVSRRNADERKHGDEAWARWLASIGLSAEQIAEHFIVESLGRRRRAVSAATIRRWAGEELRQYRAWRKLVLASHPLLADVKVMRLADLPQIIHGVEALRDEYRRTKSLACWIVLEECMRQINRRVHVKSCVQCAKPFLSRRSDSRYCPNVRCRKAASRSNVTDNGTRMNTNSISGGEMTQLSEIDRRRMDRQQRSLDRIEQFVAVIAETVCPDRIPSAVFSQAVDGFLRDLGLESEEARN
jgi:hypothetical protein